MLRTLALTALLTVPVAAQQTAQDVMTTALQKEAARQAGISNYVIIQSTDMMQAPAYYEKENIGGQVLFRLVPMSEWQKRQPSAIQDPAAFAGAMAMGIDMLKGPMEREMAGAPGGAIMGAYLSDMMTDWATFGRAVAVAEDSISDGRDEARSTQQGRALFGSRARLVGTEVVDTFQTFHLLADDLTDIPVEQPEDGGTVTMIDANLWLDATDYVPRRLLMHMDVENDGRHVPIEIELVLSDYQRKGTLLVAGHHAMRLSGLMEAMAIDSKDRKKLEKARREAEQLRTRMANMDEEMAKVPASMRAMVQGQVDKALAQLDMLANEGAFVAELTFRIHSVNAGPPFDWIPTPGSGD
jgi:hypothetical protein